MLMLVTTAVFLQSVPYLSVNGAPDFVQRGTLIFIGSQAILSYFTASLCKLKAGWGKGDFFKDLLECRSFVTPEHSAMLKRHAWLLGPMEAQVVLMQMSSVGLFFLGPEFGYLFIAWSFLFHLLGSLFLGLRSFSHSFLAVYPALWFLAQGMP